MTYSVYDRVPRRYTHTINRTRIIHRYYTRT